ncbi:hypothetical protein CLV36_102379 [Laceyella sediminis]|uniref:Uncharacterized protein n=2 Tax=Laceyella TaxID=292635 RepID=A0AA45WS24_9BACL|nr:hypothetical protein CLV36_102379 [Laceyella sediminis]SMP32879.1 hypothetical protein SAMN06265361_10962 [Laceyella tengchongensis]
MYVVGKGRNPRGYKGEMNYDIKHAQPLRHTWQRKGMSYKKALPEINR